MNRVTSVMLPLPFRKVHGSYSSILPREVIQRQKGGWQLEADKEDELRLQQSGERERMPGRW